MKKTFDIYPNIKNTFDELNGFAIKNNFCKDLGNGAMHIKGRRYDNAILFNSGDFVGKTVCELGGRDGIFSSWLTKYVDKVYVSDYFELWGKGTEHDLGDFEYWENVWTKSAYDSEKIICDTQDITKLTYPDNMFDIVICTSVIEHMFPQCEYMGDMVAIREISRITKPGGLILLSTNCTASKSKWHSGTFYYNEQDLFDRIINPSKCKLNGEYNFSFNDSDNDAHEITQDVGICSSVVFSMIKP